MQHTNKEGSFFDEGFRLVSLIFGGTLFKSFLNEDF